MKRWLVALLLAPLVAWAQAYPSKPVRFVVPFPPGNAGDIMARMLAEKMTQSMKQSVIVENQPGAGGNIGAEYAAKAPADGYTVLIAASGIVTANRLSSTSSASIRKRTSRRSRCSTAARRFWW